MDSSQSFIRQEFIIKQKRWAIALLFSGCMTFFMSSFIEPIFGSFLVFLGIVNLLINGRGLLLINSLILFLIAGVTLTGSIDSVMAFGNVRILTAIGLAFGLFEGLLGAHELDKFIRYQRRISQSRSSQS